MTTTGGQEVNQLYFYWPVLTSGANFNENSLPNTTLEITIDELTGLTRSTTSVSDAYGQFDGPNRFPQSTREQGIHPDQHNLLIYDIDQTTQAFRMLIGNDGGVYISVKDTDPGVKEGDFDFISYGYNTTQFYGADKAPGQDRYFGGMQDNGSWYNATGTEGSASSQSTFGIGGDGFEVLWHSTNVSRMIGGSQYNGMGRSLTGGNSWESATTGLPFGAGQAPFITRLSHHKSSPDRIFAVAATGVYRSTNFGGAWIASTMNEASQWSFNNSADVEVSYADPDVVWAGGSLDNNRRLYVSTNAGVTFNPVNNYTVHNLGFVSGIGTHPSDSKIAYALFSFAGFPKVLRTTDMGQSWTDISGFNGTGSASTRGFPDVAVNCIYVFEDNPARIWVGSEIGIIESLDNGQSWNLLNANLPPVNVHDFKKVDDQLVVATYGRGIWSVTLEQNFSLSVDRLYVTPAGDWKADVTFEDTFDSVEVVLQNALVETLRAVAPGSTSLTFIASGADGLKTFKLDAYKDGIKQQSVSNQSMLFQIGDVVDAYSTNFEETASDFVADELTIANFPTLSGKGIHSAHPYKENEEAVMYFKRPVEVQPGGRLYYRDIALIEPGQANSVHTEEVFRDYVIVEGTSNGFDWLPLEGGYDASLHSDWTAAFTSNQVTSALFKNQTVDLNSAFTSGDKILIRFRLYSDATAAGWGWVIDDFYVQEEPLALRTTINDELELFPNPVTETATIRFSDKVPTEIKVIDLQGKLVEVISNHDQEKILTWNPSNALKGVFLLQYEMDGERYSTRVVVE